MKLVDANVLLYARDEGSTHHRRAKQWLEQSLSGTEAVGFAWIVLLAFVRISTSARVYEAPSAVDEAMDIVDGWLECTVATTVHPTSRHPTLLRELLAHVGVAGNLTSDAHLAALSIEHGAELCSADADFSRFPGVRWVDLLGT